MWKARDLAHTAISSCSAFGLKEPSSSTGYREKCRKTQEECPATIEELSDVSDCAAKRAWAGLIKPTFLSPPRVVDVHAGSGEIRLVSRHKDELAVKRAGRQ